MENKRELITKYMSALALTVTFFSSQVFGGHDLTWLKYILPLFAVGAVWCLCLIIMDFKGFLQIFKASFLYWIIGMNILIFIYGRIIWVVVEAYARSQHLLFLSHLLVMVGILWQERKRLEEIWVLTSVIMLVSESVFVTVYNWHYIVDYLAGATFERIGETPNAGLIETSMTIAFCLLPMIFQLVCKKKWIFIAPIALGMVVLVMDGSKVGMLVMAATVFVLAVGLPAVKTTSWRNLGIFVAAIAVLTLMCYMVPVLREAVFNRFADLIHTLITMDMTDMHSSSSRRLQFAVLAFINAWKHPIFGHGFETFGKRVVGFDTIEYVWPNSHNNFTEIFFSCGLCGVVTYYWFPILMMVRTIKAKHSYDKLVMTALLMMMVCFDISNISFRKNIIGYVAFTIIYLINKEKAND